MEALFCKLVSLSWGAGWMVLALLALRLVFRRAPKWLLCALWGLVALRLLCPVTLTSPFALLPDGLAELPAAGWTAEALPQAVVPENAQPEENPAGDPIIAGDSTPVGGEASAGDTAHSAPRPTLMTVLSGIWLAGTAAMLLYALVSLLRLRRRMATATRLAGNLKQSEQVGSPFVLGLFRPTIYLPYRIEPGDLAQVVAHERAHLARGDHWWKVLGFALLSVYWFHPLLWVAYHLFCRDMEAACDQRVIRGMDREGRRAYASALLRCSTKPSCSSPCPLAFGELRVRDRIKGVMEHRPAALWVTVLAGAAGLIAAVCLLTRPVPAQDTLELTGSWDNDRVTYTLTLGSQVERGVLYAEQWTDGVCVRSAPLPLTPETGKLLIRMDMYGEYGARTGTDIQIDTDQQAAALVARFPSPPGAAVVGWARNVQEENQSIPVTTGQEVILVSQVLDTGGGVHAYDCQTYLTEPQRLAEAKGTILIRACFGEDPYAVPASPSSAAPVTAEPSTAPPLACRVMAGADTIDIAPAYYPGEFDWDYDQVPVCTVSQLDALVFDPGWETASLEVREDHYYQEWDGTNYIKKYTYSLTPDGAGGFALVPQQPFQEGHHSYFFLPVESGIYVLGIDCPSPTAES